jgi:hypothetical protein
VVFAIQAIFALTPAAFALLAFFIALRFPIDEAAHRAILQGIERHREGKAARDPLTGALILPPQARQLDEDTRWFLDHFSPRELRRFAAGDKAFPLRNAALHTVLALSLAAAILYAAIHQVRSFESDPGVWAVLGIVASGFSVALAGFHASRIAAARRLAAARSVSPEAIAFHLEQG